MSRRLLFLPVALFALLFASLACNLSASSAPETPEPVTGISSPASSPDAADLEAATPSPEAPPSAEGASSPTPLPPTEIPPSITPTETPPPTPTPTEAVLGPANILESTSIRDYSDDLAQAIGGDLFEYRVNGMDYSRDGSRVAVTTCTSLSSAFICDGDAENGLVVLDTGTGLPALLLSLGKDRLADVMLSPDGSIAYALLSQPSRETYVMAWDVNTGEQAGIPLRVSGQVNNFPALCLSPDGRRLGAALGALGLYVIDPVTGRQAFMVPGKFGECAFNSDGSRLFALTYGPGGYYATLFGYDTATGAAIAATDLGDGVRDMAVSPDGRSVAYMDGAAVYVWDADTGDRVAALSAPPGEDWIFYDGTFSPDGRLLVATMLDTTDDSLLHYATAWETAGWSPVGDLRGFTFAVRELVFNAEGDRFVGMDDFGKIKEFGLPDQGFAEAEQVLADFIEALVSGDYASAAEMFLIDPSDPGMADWIRSLGGDPGDMEATLALACLPDAFPCLPLGEILFTGRVEFNDYMFVVRLLAPDGSIFVSPDGYTEHWVYAKDGPDGRVRIISLPPGAFTP